MNLSSLESLLNPQTISGGAQAMDQAPQGQIDAHRGLLGEAFSMLQQQGGNPQQLAANAGASEMNPGSMGSEDMVRTTLALAQSHPQIIEQLASQFPEAQPIVNMVLGNAASSGGAGGSGIGSLLGRLTGL